MAKYKSVVITNAGLELVAATHSGGSIEFTAVKTGNGVYDDTEVLENMTDLKGVQQTFGITGITREAAVIKVRSVISNKDMTEGYYLTEIDLYVLDPNTDTEILYAIIVAEDNMVDYFTAYTDFPQSMTLEIYIAVTGIEEGVTFIASTLEEVYVTAQDLEEFRIEVEALKKSASDGKTLVASAITDKGISTANNATYQIMATNIRNIQTGINTSDATVTAPQILSGAVAYGSNGKVVGTMTNNGAVSKTLAANGSYTIPAGYHNGSGKVTVDSLTTAKLNVFTQATEPVIKDGIWVKTANPHRQVIIDNRVLNEGGAWGGAINDLPIGFYGGCAVVYGGEVYILGGYMSTTSFYKWNGSSWV